MMGILNMTPDSFSDGGRYDDPGAGWARAQEMIEEGADVIDVGGESTRPGARYIEEEEEIRRVRPLLEILGKKSPVPFSIDTRKAAVARVALDLGASIVNDVSALRDDPGMARVVQSTGAGIVLMHRQGHSDAMQTHPFYRDVVEEVQHFLSERLAFAQAQGIALHQIILDPGIGFGKTLIHNLELLANLEGIVKLGRPVLIGLSRKKFLGELTNQPVHGREGGHASALTAAILQGVHIIRVHEVAAAREAVCVAKALREAHHPSNLEKLIP